MPEQPTSSAAPRPPLTDERLLQLRDDWMVCTNDNERAMAAELIELRARFAATELPDYQTLRTVWRSEANEVTRLAGLLRQSREILGDARGEIGELQGERDRLHRYVGRMRGALRAVLHSRRKWQDKVIVLTDGLREADGCCVDLYGIRPFDTVELPDYWPAEDPWADVPRVLDNGDIITEAGNHLQANGGDAS